jgi:8-amino-7-oxononanoate synthase
MPLHWRSWWASPIATVPSSSLMTLMLSESWAKAAGGLGVAAGADIVVGTLGKAVGAAGAFVAGPAGLAELLWNRARTLVFSTGLTTGTQAAAVEGVAILRSAEGDRRRQVLRDHRGRLGPRAAGLPGAIVPLVIGADADAVAASSRLEAQGFWIPRSAPRRYRRGPLG